MSLSFPNLVLPNAGLGWNFAKRSKFSTIVQTPQSMRHPASATLQTSVIYELELTFNGLCNVGTSYADDANTSRTSTRPAGAATDGSPSIPVSTTSPA